MTIEIYGLPGSGKTTLAEKMAAAGYKIIKARTGFELFFYNLLFFIKQPVKFIAMLYYVIVNSFGWKMFYHKLMNCFLHPNARLEKASRFDKAVVDQGQVLNIWAVLEKELAEEEARKFLRFIRKPDLLVILKLPADLAMSRASQRGYFARDDFPDEYRRRWQEIMIKNDLTLNKVVNDSLINYRLVNADRTSDEMLNEVVSKI